MGSRGVSVLLAGFVTFACAASLTAYHIGVKRGFNQGLGAASSTFGVTTGIQALGLVKALDADQKDKVKRGLDLMIDTGVAGHYLHLQVPHAMGGEPNENQQWLYERLIGHRRQVPSSIGKTKHIGPQVAAALANSP